MGSLALWGQIMTGLVGIVAVLITVLVPQTTATKTGAIVIVVVLTVAAIALNSLKQDEDEKLAKQRDVQIENHGGETTRLRDEIGTLREQQSRMLSFFKIDEPTVTASLKLSESLAVKKIPGTPESLKERVKALSTSMLRFLLERAQGEPSMPRRETWSDDVERQIKYSRETMRLYSLSFGSRVIASRNALAEHGLVDTQLDQLYEFPTNPIGIQIVGERLGALTERLP